MALFGLRWVPPWSLAETISKPLASHVEAVAFNLTELVFARSEILGASSRRTRSLGSRMRPSPRRQALFGEGHAICDVCPSSQGTP